MDLAAADRRFRSLYEEYQRPVLGYFLRRTDATSARDGAADTFLVAWRRLDDVPDGDRALPWLFGVARRVLANQRRSRDRFRTLGRKLATLGADPEPTPEAIVVRRAEDVEMLDAVAGLRPEDREVLRLATWEELPYADIAQILGTSPHAVAQRVHRITRKLAHQLEPVAAGGHVRRATRSSDGGGTR